MAGLGRVTVSERKSCWIGVLIAAPGGWSGYFATASPEVLAGELADQASTEDMSSGFEPEDDRKAAYILLKYLKINYIEPTSNSK